MEEITMQINICKGFFSFCTCNAEYFSSHGMSISENLTDELPRIVEEVLQNPDKGAEMVACQKKIINATAAADICRLAEQLVGEV